MKRTSAAIRDMKHVKKIVALTSYSYWMTTIINQADIDLILVGDSLASMVLGYKDTIPVTMDEMIHHTKAVSRADPDSLVVADMPFMSYQASQEKAVENAGRFIKEAGAEAVKLEGGGWIKDMVYRIIQAGIPVLGHIGLTPQSIHQIGGYKVQGRDPERAKKLIEDALLLEQAGVFAIVLECVPSALARDITKKLHIPTIGIGAGPYCDGQILVIHDMLGLKTGHVPKFVKQYANLTEQIAKALEDYKKDVTAGKFPDKEHSYE
ncbi:3-methyl-2-oxobutanoate hydroxymethyltransferase [bacterium]|nr:3-methyl-2-oxobutanoate hydroxymethyltransferase [bacterium]